MAYPVMEAALRRRAFITLLGGTAAAWPLPAQAQKTDRLARIGVLMGYAETDSEAKALLGEFTHALSEFGWIKRQISRMDVRWAPAKTDLMRTLAKELVSLQPDLILTDSTPVTAAVKRETTTIPHCFCGQSPTPVGSGFVASLPRPGGNVTGFSSLRRSSIASKWLELLTGIAPGVKRAMMLFNPDTAPFIKSYALPSFEAAARSLKVALIVAPVHNDTEIEAAIAELAETREAVSWGCQTDFIEIHRALIIYAGTRETIFLRSTRRPLSPETAVCFSYGADFQDIFHRPPAMLIRILRGAKPSELPVQLPTKYLMVINLRTAKATRPHRTAHASSHCRRGD